MTCLLARKLAVSFAGTIPTTEMQVTSIRLERELKEKLKGMAGNQGYQALIRDILWDYVRLRSGDSSRSYVVADLRAVVPARATQEQRCAVTGTLISARSECLLGVTVGGDVVTIASHSLDSAE